MIAPLLSRRGWTAAVVLSVLAGWGVGVRAGHGRRPEAGATVRFVACPIYRDTDQGRKSGCWLADDPATGARYDLTWSPIKPQAGKPVLVEGVVTEASDTCGGVVLQPVRVSVLPEPGCTREILAAEGYPGRPSPPPVAMLAPSSQPRTLPPPPYVRRAFHIYFEFGRRFLQYQHAEVILEQVQLYVRASDAKRVRIVGFAATEPVRYGQRRLAEPDRLALDRAEIVALALHRLGVPDAIVAIQVSKAPAPTELEGGRLPESSKRRVTVMVTP